MQEKIKLLKPKLDIVFHSLFSVGNEEITKAIISAITKEKIKEINLNNDRNILGKYSEEKAGILDLKATLDNGIICNIEIQLADNKDTAERFLYYWSRIYSSQLKKGEDYKKLNKVIGIIILDYKFEKTKELERIHTKWKIKEILTERNIELTDKLELHILEIPKAKRIIEKNPNDELAQWMMFLDDPNKEGVLKIMKENKEIKKAMNELEEISKDEELRRWAELKEKWLKDENSKMARWKEDGLEKGMKEGMKKGMKEGIEKGIEKGMEKGMEKGIKKGIEKGVEKEKKEIAKTMKNKGFSIKEIVELTGLEKEKIKKL